VSAVSLAYRLLFSRHLKKYLQFEPLETFQLVVLGLEQDAVQERWQIALDLAVVSQESLRYQPPGEYR
jgi:hypothetical protein